MPEILGISIAMVLRLLTYWWRTTRRAVAVLATRKIPVEDGFESITQADVQPTSRALSPLLLDKALSRRLDWTPPKTSAGSVVELELQGAQSRSSFPQGLLERFSYEGASARSSFGSKQRENAQRSAAGLTSWTMVHASLRSL